MCNEEEETMMAAPVKPMQPMNIDFKDEYDRDRFVNWAASKQKDNSDNMNRIREEYKNIKGMRRKGF
jgi:hypothetical protein